MVVIASFGLAITSPLATSDDTPSPKKMANLVKSCVGSNEGAPVFVVEESILCIFGPLRRDSVPEDLVSTDIRLVVIHSGGGSLGAFTELAELLSPVDPIIFVPNACVSACAMVLLPIANRAFISSNAVVARHRYLFSDISSYSEYALNRKTNPVPLSDPNFDSDLSPIEYSFNRYIMTLKRLETLLRDIGVDDRYFEHLSEPPQCFDPSLPFYDWEYYSILDKSFYSKIRDTSGWSWENAAGKPSIEGFPAPVCDANGELLSSP